MPGTVIAAFGLTCPSRLLGSRAVRRRALAKLARLPANAWQRRVAQGWLLRLRFEVAAEAEPALKELVMETRDLFEEWMAEHDRERDRERDHVWQQKLQTQQAAAEQELTEMACARCAMRLTRPLAEAERATVGERCRRLGTVRVSHVIATRSTDALVAWLADPIRTRPEPIEVQ